MGFDPPVQFLVFFPRAELFEIKLIAGGPCRVGAPAPVKVGRAWELIGDHDGCVRREEQHRNRTCHLRSGMTGCSGAGAA